MSVRRLRVVVNLLSEKGQVGKGQVGKGQEARGKGQILKIEGVH